MQRKHKFAPKTYSLVCRISKEEFEKLDETSRRTGLGKSEMIRQWIAQLPLADQLGIADRNL